MGRPTTSIQNDPMRQALRLARRGYGTTSPNPMVGAVLVKRGVVIGRGWHRRAGGPHAEVEALRDAQKRGFSSRGATLYVTLEPCCTHGRTPPCTDAILAAGIKRVVVGAVDPNPKHAGRGLQKLRHAGVEVLVLAQRAGRKRRSNSGGFGSNLGRVQREVSAQSLADQCVRLNEGFNHWIVHGTPFVTVKAAMTLDGKIATAGGDSKWITGVPARAVGMKLRQGSDAILVGINTILHDDPKLTVRSGANSKGSNPPPRLRRIVLDSMARTPLTATVVSDEQAALTTIVVSRRAPPKRVSALARRVNVLVAPLSVATRHAPRATLDLSWLLRQLGAEAVTKLLVEGGGEVNASFLLGGFTQRVAFFYAPKILGGRDARKAVGGDGVKSLREVIQLREIKWRKLGPDLLLTAKVVGT